MEQPTQRELKPLATSQHQLASPVSEPPWKSTPGPVKPSDDHSSKILHVYYCVKLLNVGVVTQQWIADKRVDPDAP